MDSARFLFVSADAAPIVDLVWQVPPEGNDVAEWRIDAEGDRLIPWGSLGA